MREPRQEEEEPEDQTEDDQAPGERPVEGGSHFSHLQALQQIARNTSQSVQIQQETLSEVKKTQNGMDSMAASMHCLADEMNSQANVQTRKDARMILEPLMQRYTYYPENEIIEEVVSQVMGTATVQEARQADMKKFGLLKNQVAEVARMNIRSDLAKVCKRSIIKHFKCTDNPADKLPWSNKGQWIEANANTYLHGCGYRKGTTADSHGSKRWRKLLLDIWPHPDSTVLQNEDKPWETPIKHLTAPMVGYLEAVLQHMLSTGKKDLPNKGADQKDFQNNYASLTEELKQKTSAHLVIKSDEATNAA